MNEEIIDTKNKDNLHEVYSKLNNNFGHPCIVHAMNREGFVSALKLGKLTWQSEELKRIGSLEEDVNVHKSVWLSVGFLYNAIKDEKNDYGFIFNSEIIDSKFHIYQYHIISLLHKEIIRYLKKENELAKLMSRSDAHKRIIQSFLLTDEKGNGNEEGNFPWWEIKEDIYEEYEKHKDKLKDHLKKKLNEYEVKHERIGFIENVYKSNIITRGEIICKKEIDLNSKYLLGIYVKENKKDISELVKKFRENRKILLFDGKSKK